MDTKQGTELATLADDVSVSLLRLEELLKLHPGASNHLTSDEMNDIADELSKISRKLAALAQSVRLRN